MLHIFISDQHWNNRITESDKNLNEIKQSCQTHFDAQMVHSEILIAKLAKLLLSINQEIGYWEVADDITHQELSFLLETPKQIFSRILMYFEHK